MFRRNVAGPMNPAVVRRHFPVYPLEVAVDWLAKVLAHHADHTPGEEDDDTYLKNNVND